MIVLETPNNLIIQRDSTGRAVLPIKGSCARSVTSITIQLTPVKAGWGTELSTTMAVQGGSFNDTLTAKSGWYTMSITNEAGESITQKIGVGEVFMITGHSIASNNARGYPEELAINERVMTIDYDNNTVGDEYNRTLNGALIPFKFVPVAVRKQIPINSDPQHWGHMAHRLSEQLNVPVLLMNCAYGGSSLEMWAKGIRGEKYGYFDNPDGERQPGQVFNWEKPLPYGTMRHMMQNIIAKTGLRAVLSHHGENDRTPADQVAEYYKTLIETSRTFAPGVSWLICRSCVSGRNADGSLGKLTEVRKAQEKVIQTVKDCYAGPDYDAAMNDLKPGADEVLSLTKADRYDDLHLSVTGLRKASVLWADSVNQQINMFTPFTPVKPATQGGINTEPNLIIVPTKYTNSGNTLTAKVEETTGLKLHEAGLLLALIVGGIVYLISGKK